MVPRSFWDVKHLHLDLELGREGALVHGVHPLARLEALAPLLLEFPGFQSLSLWSKDSISHAS